ncbi:transmembrane protein 104 homolog isoform X2 [Drosophila virilis]|uniref:transmembrane protein 104 homolog isoform X2 n=1 Tax=Drosophila virilis TaxID=7244 RepID=UPI001395D8F2|nr:transmembrane protein 104 homolog isoform X2 [Drosophila virilis]
MPGGRISSLPVDTVSYSNLVGFIFIFNLIVGTGALTLPGVFSKAGWCLSLVVIILLAIISYITVTFVIESMAGANAIKNWQSLQVLRHRRSSNEDEDNERFFNAAASETTPLTIQNMEFHYYQLTHKFELGEMATIFFNDFGRILFYLCFIIYLYGDLSIYSAVVAKSLRDVICEHEHSNTSDITNWMQYLGNFEGNETNERACWQDHTISRLIMYRIILIGFTLIFGPLAVLSIQKTKYLQILTALFRCLAFALMICIALKMLVMDGARGRPVAINFYGIPSLFGACVYSFMCHHSLPSLLEPLRNKCDCPG